MKQILMFARDPGGANVLIPIYHRLKEKYQISLFGKEVALQFFEKNQMPVKDIQKEVSAITQETIYQFLKKQKPDFILTGTSLDDYTERYLWKAGNMLGINSAVILDQWINLGIRFSPYGYEEAEEYQKSKIHTYIPKYIMVMDELARKMLQSDGIPSEHIIVTGQPHFDIIWEKYQNAIKQNVSSTGEEKYSICYASEPIWENYDKGNSTSYWGYDEKTNFYALYQCLEKLTDQLQKSVKVIIRPHPRESIGFWEEVIKTKKSDRIELCIDEKSDSFTLLKSVDLICGMSSMFLLESVICGKPIVSIQIGLKRENPFVLSKLGICPTQQTKEALEKELKSSMLGTKKPIEFSFIKNATERVVSYIEKEMQQNECIGN